MEHISAFWIYILAMLPEIKSALDFSHVISGMLLIGAIALIIIGMMFGLGCETDRQGTRKEKTKALEANLKRWVPYKTFVALFVMFSCLTFASNFIPNYKQAAIIIGGTWAVNNENVRQLPDEIAGAVNRLLESVGHQEKIEKSSD